MNLPMNPSIAMGSDGVVHAFWYQEFYDDCLNFTGDAIFYKTRQGGVWTDRSEILGGHEGPWSRITLDRFGQPSFVWRDRWIWPADIGAAIFEPGADVEDQPGDLAAPILAAPNPFTTSTVLRLGATGHLEVVIHDTAGRIVRRLVGSSSRVERLAGIPWDGRDDAGRSVPAGVYWARLSHAEGQTTISVVRIE